METDKDSEKGGRGIEADGQSPIVRNPLDIAYQSIEIKVWRDSIFLDGKEFDFPDVMETMDALDGPGNGRVVGPLGPVLQSMGVLEACGTRDTTAINGPRFQELLELLHKQEEKLSER